MRHYLLLLVLGFALSLTSCRNDFEFEPSTGGLEFSRDTVYLDTVFTNIGSSTYTLKVYNRSDKDISIPSLRLKKGDASKYRLMVDGDGQGTGTSPGRIFNNVELMANDSLFIFIETTVDVAEADPDDFLYTDEIEFHSTAGVQQVSLVTLIQDAIFLYPRRDSEGNYEAVPISETDPTLIYGFNLDEADPNHGNELEWTAQKPYVIYGMATVPQGKTLNVHAGARVHFHAESGLIVRNGATLNINGMPSTSEALENEVVFEGDRLEPMFSDVPGQWLTIWMQPGSRASLNNFTLKNATVGILMERNDGTPNTLALHNVQIYNCANIGLLARNGHIVGSNVAINRAGQAAAALTLGGVYNFTHCTFANYFNTFTQFPLIMNDFQPTDAETLAADLDAQFTNCIFYGSGNYGISLRWLGKEKNENAPETQFNYEFRNCLIKFADFSNQFEGEELYDFVGGNYPESIIAENSTTKKADFLDPNDNDLRIGVNSAAKNIATTTTGITLDINNNPRTETAPDAGAYEYTPE